MGRDFSVLKTNVASDIQDTSTAMQTLIGRYLNRRYMQVLRAINFTYVNDDYTIAVTAGTSSYDLPADYKTEMYAIDTTNNTSLKRIEFQDLKRDFSDELTTSGYIARYIIFTDDANQGKIKFHYVPASACTVAFPYIATPSEMSADTDEPIIGLEDIIEVGATSDAWRYKRQFSKATAIGIQFNQLFSDFVWAQENNPNDLHQFTPTTLDRDSIY